MQGLHQPAFLVLRPASSAAFPLAPHPTRFFDWVTRFLIVPRLPWALHGPRLSICRDKQQPSPMLTALRQGVRLRLAATLAAFAALCFALPPAVLAFGHGEHTIQCLAHADAVDHDMGQAGGHADHGDHSLPPASHHAGSGCCGLFCMSALPADLSQTLAGLATRPALRFPPPPHPLSRGPEQPDRPPISLSVL